MKNKINLLKNALKNTEIHFDLDSILVNDCFTFVICEETNFVYANYINMRGDEVPFGKFPLNDIYDINNNYL